MTTHQIAALIDHAILQPTFTDAFIRTELEFAGSAGCAAVFTQPYVIATAVDVLKGTRTAVGAVVGFPQGGVASAMKVAETHHYCGLGATEVDMVVNVGKTLSGEWGCVEDDIALVKRASDSHGVALKVIFETDYIRDPGVLTRLCHVCSQIGVAYVKTSTGFAYTQRDDGQFRVDGARDSDIVLMRRESAPGVKVKAAGGIRTLSRLLRLHELGAARIGTSATRSILAEIV